MVPSLGTQLEKGKTLSNTEEAPEEWELLRANQRDPLSLTNRFSSKILGLRAPRRGATAGGSEGSERQRETWSCQHTARAVGLAASPTQSDTAHAGGGTAGNVSMGDTGGISPAFLRREDIERKNAMV